MKKLLFSSLLGAFLFAGCSTSQPANTIPDYQAQDQNSEESMMDDSMMMKDENSTEVSKSTELDDIDKELQGTTISEEDFSDL